MQSVLAGNPKIWDNRLYVEWNRRNDFKRELNYGSSVREFGCIYTVWPFRFMHCNKQGIINNTPCIALKLTQNDFSDLIRFDSNLFDS